MAVSGENTGSMPARQEKNASKKKILIIDDEEDVIAFLSTLLEDNGYFNPHLLVKSDFKRDLRNTFFKALLERTRVYEVNTTGTPEESQKIIRKIAELNDSPR